MTHKKPLNPECIWDLKAQLGEAPIWVESEQALYFVDVFGQKIHRYDPASDTKLSWDSPGKPCFIVASTNEKFVVGIDKELYWFNPKTGRMDLWINLTGQKSKIDFSNTRLNDAYVDAQGRLWFSNMDAEEEEPNGSLFLLDWEENNPRISCQDQGYVVPNGPLVSPDGKVLYHNHTPEQHMYRFEVDEDGNLSNKELLVKVEEGCPDGMGMDKEGNIWVCLYGGYQMQFYSKDGELREVIPFPCPNVTKVAFGGPDLTTAFVTTATRGIDAKDLVKYPLAGGLFSFKVSIPGRPQKPFSVPPKADLKEQVF